MCGIIQLYGGEYSMDYVGKRTKLFYKGTQIDFHRCAQEQFRRYPDSRIQDWVKLASQAAMARFTVSPTGRRHRNIFRVNLPQRHRQTRRCLN